MKKQETRIRVRHGLLEGVMRGLGALGTIHVEFNPPRYPRNAQFLDQKRIGAYMYRAMERYGKEVQQGKPAAT